MDSIVTQHIHVNHHQSGAQNSFLSFDQVMNNKHKFKGNMLINDISAM